MLKLNKDNGQFEVHEADPLKTHREKLISAGIYFEETAEGIFIKDKDKTLAETELSK